MNRDQRKAAVAAYKERKPKAAVYAVRCAADGAAWVGPTLNPDTVQNKIWFTLRLGSHPNRALQAAWAAHGEAAFAVETAADVFGTERAEWAEFPLTGAEDFSFVLEQVPGAFVMLGACPAGTDPITAPTNHSARATFDDAALADGTALYAELALRRLAMSRAGD